MVYIGHELEKPIALKRLLKLTTENIHDRPLTIGDLEVEFSCGLADLFLEYIGSSKPKRQQKLFPHLSIDRLEDQFHKASEKLIQKGSVPVLPEAFLSFPHTSRHVRMRAQQRRHQQSQSKKIYHESICFKELKKQLTQKTPSTHS